jgi:uncharacterized membrane protein YhaH (DUF805 family)
MNYYLNAWSNFANFSGRARRSEYWFFALFNFIFYILFLVLSGLLNSYILVVIYYIAIIIPSLAVAVRRMHDVGKSGWYILIPIYSLILLFTEGTRGDNEYGPDPKN